MTKNLPILSISFRPFFLLAALVAVINPTIWKLSYLGHISFPSNLVDPLFWHGHEMVFGFTGALIAGFILTASAKWTKSVPYQGKSLLIIIFLWLVERFAYFLAINDNLKFALLNLFFPALSIMLLRKLWHFPKQRNIFMPILLGLTLGKAFHSWGSIYSVNYLAVSGREMAIGLIRLIILLIAGRVIPFFTKNKIQGVQINLPPWINLISLFSIALLAVPWPESTPKLFLVTILTVAVIANILRQFLWKPQVTLKVPILYILHIGVGLINIELILKLIGIFNPKVHFTHASLHLLLAGGLGVVGMGIMTRVTLGHTGRAIRANFWTGLSYLSIVLGTLLRVFVPIFISEFYFQSLHISSGLWTLGFAIFLLRYTKIMFTQRPDGKPY